MLWVSPLECDVTAGLSRQNVLPAQGSLWRWFVGGGQIGKAESVGSVQAGLSGLVWGKADANLTVFLLFMFSHISGNKIGWEKTGSHSEPQARGDPGDQTKVVGWLLFFRYRLFGHVMLGICSKQSAVFLKHVMSNRHREGGKARGCHTLWEWEGKGVTYWRGRGVEDVGGEMGPRHWCRGGGPRCMGRGRRQLLSSQAGQNFLERLPSAGTDSAGLNKESLQMYTLKMKIKYIPFPLFSASSCY